MRQESQKRKKRRCRSFFESEDPIQRAVHRLQDEVDAMVDVYHQVLHSVLADALLYIEACLFARDVEALPKGLAPSMTAVIERLEMPSQGGTPIYIEALQDDVLNSVEVVVEAWSWRTNSFAKRLNEEHCLLHPKGITPYLSSQLAAKALVPLDTPLEQLIFQRLRTEFHVEVDDTNGCGRLLRADRVEFYTENKDSLLFQVADAIAASCKDAAYDHLKWQRYAQQSPEALSLASAHLSGTVLHARRITLGAGTMSASGVASPGREYWAEFKGFGGMQMLREVFKCTDGYFADLHMAMVAGIRDAETVSQDAVGLVRRAEYSYSLQEMSLLMDRAILEVGDTTTMHEMLMASVCGTIREFDLTTLPMDFEVVSQFIAESTANTLLTIIKDPTIAEAPKEATPQWLSSAASTLATISETREYASVRQAVQGAGVAFMDLTVPFELQASCDGRYNDGQAGPQSPDGKLLGSDLEMHFMDWGIQNLQDFQDFQGMQGVARECGGAAPRECKQIQLDLLGQGFNTAPDAGEPYVSDMATAGDATSSRAIKRPTSEVLAQHVDANTCAALKSFPRAGMLYAQLCENGHDQAIQNFQQQLRMATL